MPLLNDDSGTPILPPPSLPPMYPDQPGVIRSATGLLGMVGPQAPAPQVPPTVDLAGGLYGTPQETSTQAGPVPDVGGALNTGFEHLQNVFNKVYQNPLSALQPPTLQSMGIQPPTPQYEQNDPNVSGLVRQPQMTPESSRAQRNYNNWNNAFVAVAGAFQPEGRAGGFPEGSLGAKMFARSGEQQAAEAGQTTVAQAENSSLLQRQVDALKAGGATDQQIEDFQKTMAPQKQPYTTAQGGEIDFSKMTRAIQTALGHDEAAGMPPALEPYSTRGKFAPSDLSRHGGVVGAAGRALLAGDPEVMNVLPQELSQRLIQGRLAQMARDAGVSEEALRAAFPVSEALPEEVRSAIRSDLNAGAVTPEVRTRTEAAAQTALAEAGIPPSPAVVQAVADRAIAQAKNTNRIAAAFGGAVQPTEASKLEQTIRQQAEAQGIDVNEALRAVGIKGGGRPPQGPPAPPTGGKIPSAPGPAPKAGGPSLLRAAEQISGVPKSLLVSAAPFHGLLRHGLPFAIAHPTAWGAGWRGGWNALRSTPEEALARLQELRTAVDANGGKRLYMGAPHGGIASGEEAAASNLINRVPVLGWVTQRMGQSFTQSLNEMRAAAFNGLVNGARESGAPFSQDQINELAETINHFSGRGFRTDTPAKAAFARAANTVFFSPELQVSRIRMWTDTLQGVADLARNPSDPIAREKVRLGVGYLAGVAAMYGLAQMAGMKVNLDPRSTTAFKIDLGTRSEAAGFLSSLASEIGMTTSVLAGRAYADPTAGESTYIRALARIITSSSVSATGKESQLNTQKFAGQTSSDVLGSLLEGKLSPAVSEMLSALNREGIDWTDLGMPLPIREYLAGSGKITEPQFGTEPKRDAVGRLDDGTLPVDPVLDAWKQVQDGSVKKADGTPSFASLTVPNRTIGTGKNAIVLDDKETDRLQQLVGQSRENLIGQLINSPQWATLGQADKEKRLAGAKTEADRQGQIAFGIEHAQQSPDDLGKARGALVVLDAAGQDTGRRMDAIVQLQSAGVLNQTVKDAIDELRAHKDPLASGYEMTVDQYINGSQLVSRYLKTPAYRFGTAADWTNVAREATALRTTYNALQREAEQQGKKVAQMAAYRQTYLPQYQRARIGNIPLSRYLDVNGTVRQEAISPQRIALQSDPLWKNFRGVVNKRDPYEPKPAQ